MSKFILTIGKEDIAKQIADLINSGRQLYLYQTAQTILNNNVRYILELSGTTVIGVVGLEQLRPNVTEIKHLVVHPAYRRKGIGKKMLLKAVKAASTEFVYGLVRSDNLTNIHNNLRIGMKPIGKTRMRRGHRLIVFARRRHGNVVKK